MADASGMTLVQLLARSQQLLAERCEANDDRLGAAMHRASAEAALNFSSREEKAEPAPRDARIAELEQTISDNEGTVAHASAFQEAAMVNLGRAELAEARIAELERERDDLASRALPAGSEYVCFTRGRFDEMVKEKAIGDSEMEEATIAIVDGAISSARWRARAEKAEAELASLQVSRDAAHELIAGISPDLVPSDIFDGLILQALSLLSRDEKAGAGEPTEILISKELVDARIAELEIDRDAWRAASYRIEVDWKKAEAALAELRGKVEKAINCLAAVDSAPIDRMAEIGAYARKEALSLLSPEGEAQPARDDDPVLATDDPRWIMDGDLAPEYGEIRDAGLAWCGQKGRETYLSDEHYFRNNWRSLPGLGAFVAREVSRRAAIGKARRAALAAARSSGLTGGSGDV